MSPSHTLRSILKDSSSSAGGRFEELQRRRERGRGSRGRGARGAGEGRALRLLKGLERSEGGKRRFAKIGTGKLQLVRSCSTSPFAFSRISLRFRFQVSSASRSQCAGAAHDLATHSRCNGKGGFPLNHAPPDPTLRSSLRTPSYSARRLPRSRSA